MGSGFEYHALGEYKKRLSEVLLDDSDVRCEALMDILMPIESDKRFTKLENFKGGEFECNDEFITLPSHFFEVPYIDSIVTDTMNAICLDDNISSCSKSIKDISVTIYIMCHKESAILDSKERIKYRKMGYTGSSRLDVATAIIGDILNYSDIKSIGKIIPDRNPIRSYFPNNEYIGKILCYTASDFMYDYER